MRIIDVRDEDGFRVEHLFAAIRRPGKSLDERAADIEPPLLIVGAF